MGDKYHRVIGIDLGTTRCVVTGEHVQLVGELVQVVEPLRREGLCQQPVASVVC